ncbi:MAG: ABC transporter ATP-binding protein [Lachnospiraceae bacterium]|nr:ABC transporter ATP-binding protein [Lachnospiraceae bacterium]
MEEVILQVNNLTKSYKEKTALKNFSMEVRKGEVVALIGENGAGKTTLLNAICDFIQPSEGMIFYKGKMNIARKANLKEFGILIEPQFFDYMTAEENLRLLLYISKTHGNETVIEELLKKTELYHDRKKKVKAFSFGMKQRLGLCQSLLTPVGILILDEPFAGLDPLGKEIFKQTIVDMAHEQNIPVLFSSHDLDDVAEICDRVVMISKGEKRLDQKIEHTQTYTVKIDCTISDGTKRALLEKCPDLQFYEDKIFFQKEAYILDIQKTILRENHFICGVSIQKNNLKSLFGMEA